MATASKKGTGNVGFPEYVGAINDFLVVIEDKASLNKHLNRDEDDLIAEDVKSVTDYAVNGALFYGKHLAKHTTYKKIIAIGVSDHEKITEYQLYLLTKEVNIRNLMMLKLLYLSVLIISMSITKEKY